MHEDNGIFTQKLIFIQSELVRYKNYTRRWSLQPFFCFS